MAKSNVGQKATLLAFIAKQKFVAEGAYPGATNESDRVRYEVLINSLGTRLLEIAERPEPKATLLNEFKESFPAFEYADTEERERALGYFEELMDIFGVESSDGLLNKLLYGFDPTQSPDSRNQEAMAAMSEKEREVARKLTHLTREAAVDSLVELLGKPFMHQGNIRVWLRGNDPDNMISFTDDRVKPVLIWMVKGRFMFSLAL